MNESVSNFLSILGLIAIMTGLAGISLSLTIIGQTFITKQVDNMNRVEYEAQNTEINSMFLQPYVHGSNLYKTLKGAQINVKALRCYDYEGKLVCYYNELYDGILSDDYELEDDFKFFLLNSYKTYNVKPILIEGIDYKILITETDKNGNLPAEYEEDVSKESSIWED